MRRIRTRTVLAVTAALSLVFAAVSCSGAKTEYVDFAACGISLPVDRSAADKGLLVQSLGSDESEYPALYAFFQYIPALDAINAEMEKIADGEMTADLFNGFMEQAMLHYRQLALVYAVPREEYEESLHDGTQDAKAFSGMSRIGSRGGVVYLAKYWDVDAEGMDSEEKQCYEDCSREIRRAVKKAKFIDLEDRALPSASRGLPASVPAFTTFDVAGNPQTNQIFAQAELTVVNVWGTFCGPCIREMPELAEWNASLPAGVQLVGMISDIRSPDETESIAEARNILEGAGVTFTNILASDDLQLFLSGIQFVPTTFLVDGRGNIIGEPIIGADVKKYRKAVSDYLSGR